MLDKNSIVYFLQNDILQHFDTLNFSILNPFYIEKDTFLFYDNINYDYDISYNETKINSEIFSPFHSIVSYDSMAFLKGNFKNAFTFYEENANKMAISILSYKSLIENIDLIIDLNFQEIYELQIMDNDFIANFDNIIKLGNILNYKLKWPVFTFTVNLKNKNLLQDKDFINKFNELKNTFRNYEIHSLDLSDIERRDTTNYGEHEEYHLIDNIFIKKLCNSLYCAGNNFFLSINDIIHNMPYNMEIFDIRKLLEYLIVQKLYWYKRFLYYKQYMSNSLYSYFYTITNKISYNKDWNIVSHILYDYKNDDFNEFISYMRKKGFIINKEYDIISKIQENSIHLIEIK